MAAVKPSGLRAKAEDLVASLLYRNARVFRLRMNLYPPYLGAGIRVARVSRDFREIDVQLRRQPGNANARYQLAELKQNQGSLAARQREKKRRETRTKNGRRIGTAYLKR